MFPELDQEGTTNQQCLGSLHANSLHAHNVRERVARVQREIAETIFNVTNRLAKLSRPVPGTDPDRPN